MKTLIHRILLLLVITTAVSAIQAENWPRFRGPNGTGISEAKTVPVHWTDDDFHWMTVLPGGGHSSPVVWGERLFVTSADDSAGKRYLLCLNAANGKEAWRREFPFTKYKKHNNNSFATNTPCCDAERVYVLWQSKGDGCELIAFNHDGKEQWRNDLGAFKGGHGPAVSPIVYEDMVVVANDQDGESSLLAFDSATGKPRWRAPRESRRTQYSTPCIFNPPGRDAELIFTDMHHGITAVNPLTGQKNWEISVFGTFKQRAIASPVVTDELVIGLSGFTTAEKNAVAVRPINGESPTEAKEIWRVSKSVPHLPTPLVYNNRLYMWTDRGGIVTCINIDDGDTVWQKRIGGNFSASPVCVDGRIYCADDDGLVHVISTGDEFKHLAKNDLGHPTRATPAVAGGRMFWRTFSHVMSLGGSTP